MKKFFLVIIGLIMSMSILAAEAPDIFVKKIADDVFEILKTDKDLKAGTEKKPIKLLKRRYCLILILIAFLSLY